MASAMRRSVRLSLATSRASPSSQIPQSTRKRRRLSPVLALTKSESVEIEVATLPVSSEAAADAVVGEIVQAKKVRKKKVYAELDPSDFTRATNEWKFGAHVSAAGGVENAVVRAAEIGANAFALFLKSQRKWESPSLAEGSIALFKSRMESFGYEPHHVLPHGSYLINLGNPDEEKRQKSFDCFLEDLQRCELLGLPLYNFQDVESDSPGSTVGQATKDESISLIADCLNKAHRETGSIVTVIENMAGAGNVIGSTFSELASIIAQVEDKSRVGVCLDTCHMFAAGYDIRSRESYESSLAQFDTQIGFQYLRGMHLNDSKASLASHRDRHENVGLGHLGVGPFAFIARDARLKNIPLILETPISAPNPTKKLEVCPDIWRTEISVLNRLSRLGPPDMAKFQDRNDQPELWPQLLNEIKAVTGKSEMPASSSEQSNDGKNTRKGKGRSDPHGSQGMMEGEEEDETGCHHE